MIDQLKAPIHAQQVSDLALARDVRRMLDRLRGNRSHLVRVSLAVVTAAVAVTIDSASLGWTTVSSAAPVADDGGDHHDLWPPGWQVGIRLRDDAAATQSCSDS